MTVEPPPADSVIVPPHINREELINRVLPHRNRQQAQHPVPQVPLTSPSRSSTSRISTPSPLGSPLRPTIPSPLRFRSMAPGLPMIEHAKGDGNCLYQYDYLSINI